MIWGGSPAEIVKSAERGEVHVIASVEIVGEISDTLAYPRLERLYSGAGVSRRGICWRRFFGWRGWSRLT